MAYGFNPMGVGNSIFGGAPRPYSFSPVPNPYENAYSPTPNYGLRTVAGDVGGGGPTSTLGKVGGWITKNPDIALGAAGIAASIYGAHKQGQAEDRQALLNQQAQEQNYGLGKEDLALRQRELDTKLASDTAERQRHQRALMQILAMDRMPIHQGGA